MSIKDFNLDLPLPDIFPKGWSEVMGNVDYMSFRNIDHFISEVSLITQKEDNKCNMSYAKALDMLVKRESDFPKKEQESVRNLVRSNLHKRGLITEEVYENFRYSTDGTSLGVDIGKYTAGEPDCVITPSRQYIDFFYELYVSISYPYSVENSFIRNNVAKMLAAIEELERKHIFIKITLVFPDKDVCTNRAKSNYFSSIPLFSHKDMKSVETMSAVVNDRLLRKFFFALIENVYGDDISYGYGYPTELEGTMNIGNKFNEIEFFENIVNTVGA